MTTDEHYEYECWLHDMWSHEDTINEAQADEARCESGWEGMSE